jgi:hypothetical protein
MVTRREFLKGLGALAVAPAILTVMPSEPEALAVKVQKPAKFNTIKAHTAFAEEALADFRSRVIKPAVVPLGDKIDKQIASMYSELAVKVL